MEAENEQNPFRYLGMCISTGKEQLMCMQQIAFWGFVGPKVSVGVLSFADTLLLPPLKLVVWLVYRGPGTELSLIKAAASI